MKKVLIINCHPNEKSLCAALAQSYKMGALSSGADVKEIDIAKLHFNPNLSGGYQYRTELEPDLLAAWELILWADHLVWVHPVWWGGLPAIAKGFIDRVFLPGFAFQYKENSNFQIKLLKGKTAHILTTLDQPGWYYRLVYGRPSVNMLRKSTLEFCGIKPVKVSYFSFIRTSTPEIRRKMIARAEQLGSALK